MWSNNYAGIMAMLVERESRQMNRIPIFCIALLMMTVITLQLTALQRHILYIPAPEGPTKVRPIGFDRSSVQVVSLEEADRRYKETHGHELPPRPERDESKCMFNSCEFEFYLYMARYHTIQFFVG
jgi:hypothetical protein